MKPTGIVRKVDANGRFILPKELREVMGIDVGEPVEVFVDEDAIILKKYAPRVTCAVTGKVVPGKVKSFAGGRLALSKEGAQQLMKELLDDVEVY